MREVLFRGKSKETGKWLKGYYVCFEDGEHYMFLKNPMGVKDSVVLWCEVDPESIGQWTGLVDKNGVKIFEWDIGRDIDGKFLICWNEEKAAFVMVLQEYPYETLYLEEMWEDTEVIGNIHDEKAVEE